jgi:hypothetical protein
MFFSLPCCVAAPKAARFGCLTVIKTSSWEVPKARAKPYEFGNFRGPTESRAHPAAKESIRNDSMGFKIEGKFITLKVEPIDEITGKEEEEWRGIDFF